ncbi:MAG: restriction endonuclease subunit S [Erysipelotrichaceae bacterium]|nr:restriction endonuclease subunit S [Erysipelotrichaceae bacterium]
MIEPKLRFKADDGSQFPDWEEKTLGDIGTAKMCKRVLKEQTSEKGDVPFYKIGTFGGTPDAFISRELYEELKTKYSFPRKGNILLSAAGTIGRTVVYDGQDAFFQDSNIVWLDNDDSVLDGFLLQFYNKTSWNNLEGGTIKRLYNGLFLSKVIHVPSIPEQQKIVEFLSTIDTVIEKQKETVATWEERKKGVMQKLFSQEVRFKADDGSDFPDWEEKTLSEIASIHARIGWQNLRKDEFLTDGNYLLITGTDFCNGRVNFSTCYYVDKERYEQDKNIQVENGTILVTKDGTLGKVALVENLNKPATLNAGVFAIKVIHADTISKFLYHWLAAPMLLEYASKKSTGGTIKHLNQGILVDFPVGVPCIAEQRKIADCLSSLDEVIEKQKATLAAWEELKKGLLQQMFV